MEERGREVVWDIFPRYAAANVEIIRSLHLSSLVLIMASSSSSLPQFWPPTHLHTPKKQGHQLLRIHLFHHNMWADAARIPRTRLFRRADVAILYLTKQIIYIKKKD